MEQIPQVGDQLGRFRLERRIGQGSTGSVFLAHDNLLDADIALKLLNPFVVQSQAFERLRREVLLARQISHPSICRIFDFHQESGHYFITMEYVDGPSLETVITKSGTLSTDRVGLLTTNICEALSAAHQQDVIHRSLTPSNIIMRPGEQVSLLDFGLAKSRDMAGSTGAGAPAENIHYMSPEILMAKPATPQSDIYSLGVILYRCITGKLPFQGDSVVDITNAILAGKSIPARLLNPDVATGLGDAISKSMALNPFDRFHSAAELRERLMLFMDPGGNDPTSPSFKNIRPLSSGTLDCGLDMESADPGDSQTQQIRLKDTTILFSDIIGITPYFDKHGDIAGRKRLQKHNEILFPIVQKHNGTVLKTIGDAIMSYFESADEGVESAIEMQDVLEKYNQKNSDKESRIFIRIGLHSGHAIIENQDVFGDAVNVAARINSMAESGQILTSSHTRDKLKRSRQRTRFHSSTTLKGKSDTIKLYTVVWDKSTVELKAPRQSDSQPETKADSSPPGFAGEPEEATQFSDTATPSSLPPGVPVETTQGTGTLLVNRRPSARKAHPLFSIAIGAGIAALAIIAVGLIVMLGDPAEDRPLATDQANPAGNVSPPPLKPQTGSGIDPVSLTNNGPDQAANPNDRYKSLAVVDPPKTQPITDPEAVPKKVPKTVSLLPDLNRLNKSILGGLRSKGIRTGDSRKFDSEYRKMKKLHRKKKYQAALSAGHQALATLKEIQVDKSFIQAKLLRFNRVFDQAGDSPATEKVADMAQSIVTAVESGKYQKANRLLNQSFSILKSGGK